MKRKLIAVLLVFALAGCSSGSSSKKKNTATEAINDDEYQIVIPFQSSDARQTHTEFNRGEADIMSVGKGLMKYSQKYFSTSSYYVQEGQLLDRDTLQTGTTSTDKEGLLGFKSSTNTNGLNPKVGSSLPVSDSQTITTGNSTIPIVDIFEIDFYNSLDTDADIEGVSMAIVLNNTITDAAGTSVSVSNSKLKAIGEDAARNLLTYLQTLPEIGGKKPVMIALFKADSSDQSLPGTFLEYGEGKSSIDSFTEVNEKWAVFPSDTASNLDSVDSSAITKIQDSLHDFLPNDVGIVGKGKFEDTKLTELSITITAQTKTYTECVALTQYMKELLSENISTSAQVTVKINNNLETFAMMQRAANSSDITVIMQ